jgi:FtsH-binding integral membrane protein
MTETQPLFASFFGGKSRQEPDVENGLFPGISPIDNLLRLGFIKKVFGIVCFQLFLTAIVAMSIGSSQPARQFLYANPWILFVLSLISILGLIPMYTVKDRWPYNLVALGLWTCTFGVSVAISVSFYAPVVVGQAVLITACMVAGLTAYSFYATKRGAEFGWMVRRASLVSYITRSHFHDIRSTRRARCSSLDSSDSSSLASR